MSDYVVVRITNGLAFGEGMISGNHATAELLALIDETIHNSPALLVPIETEDDGCSDGRASLQVFTAETVFKHGRQRAKVFGGAAAMTAATLIGLGRARQPLQQVFETAINQLQARQINFGAHTDERADAVNCGCGAIDRAPEALLATIKYEAPIRHVIAALGVDTTGLDEVFVNYRAYVTDALTRADPYSGRQVMEHILAAGKVIKKLGGEHRERRIVLNQVRGYTINQRLIRLVTGGRAQIFAADIWRLEDLAAGHYPDQPALQQQALLSELIYTVGVAAVLTRGDLPVDVIKLVG